MVANANASGALLDQFFDQAQTLQSEFTQRVIDEQGMTLDVSQGRFYLSRPGKFRWDYFAIGSNDQLTQQILADGESIFVFDPDLEQVTQRSMQDALGQVPSLSLVATKSRVEQQFEVLDIGLTDGLSWVILQPLTEDSGLQQLMVGFKDEQISRIVLNDALGNETRLELENVTLNPGLDDEFFDLTVPEGTDIFQQ